MNALMTQRTKYQQNNEWIFENERNFLFSESIMKVYKMKNIRNFGDIQPRYPKSWEKFTTVDFIYLFIYVFSLSRRSTFHFFRILSFIFHSMFSLFFNKLSISKRRRPDDDVTTTSQVLYWREIVEEKKRTVNK